MRKETLTRIILIVISVMILIGSIASIIMLSSISDSRSITVKLKDGEPKQIEFSKLVIEEQDLAYTVSLKSRDEGTYKVFFAFVGERENSVSDDVWVQVSVGEKMICDASLESLFTGSAISFECDIAKRDTTDVSVIYYVPDNSEIYTSDLSFDIRIRAQKQ